MLIEQWMAQYSSDLYRVCLSILNDPDEAEDAVQETFIAASRALLEYRHEAGPRTWLYRIAVNHCLTQLRRRRSRLALARAVHAVQALFDHPLSPDQAVDTAEGDAELWAAVDRLDEKHRLPVLLRYLHGLPIKDIARVLGINEGTVHSRLYYAHRQLMRQLDRASQEAS